MNIRPIWRFEMISNEALDGIRHTTVTLAAACGCSEGAVRRWQAGAFPGGEFLGYLVLALRARGVKTTADHLLSIEGDTVE